MLIAAVALAAFAVARHLRPDDLAAARTMTFCVLVYGELFRAFAARSRTRTMMELGFFSNPYLFGAVVLSTFLQLAVVMTPFARPVFETTGHSLLEWACLALLALTPVTVIEVGKLMRRWAFPPRNFSGIP
jgi:Ca2+-transporting ATPase